VSIKKAMKFDFGERGGVINLPKITCALLFRVTVHCLYLLREI
jgi:hypothetical protein